MSTSTPLALETSECQSTCSCHGSVTCVDWRTLIVSPNLSGMSEPTPPGEPQDPAAYPPPSAPPSAPPPSAPPPPPGGGYSAGPPIGGNVAPAGYANNDEKTWALIAHFGGIVVGFIAPLVALLVKGN